MKTLLPSLKILSFAIVVSLITGILGYFVLNSLSASLTSNIQVQTYILMSGTLIGALAVLIVNQIQNRSTSVVSLFIGNLPFRASNQQLRQIFSEHGTVHNLRLMTDKVTRKPRGFGFVEMDKKHAKNAIKMLNGYEFMGRELKVNYANEK